jgi:hypothetical protein
MYYPKTNPENLIDLHCKPRNRSLPFRENLANRDLQRFGSEKQIRVGFGVTSTKELPLVDSTMTGYHEKNSIPGNFGRLDKMHQRIKANLDNVKQVHRSTRMDLGTMGIVSEKNLGGQYCENQSLRQSQRFAIKSLLDDADN